MKKDKVFQFFQKMARALMVPVSLLAASSLIMGVGSLFRQGMIIDVLPFLANEYIQYFFLLMVKVGKIVLDNLPVIYAVSLSFSLVHEEKEHAAFSGFLGYYAFISSMGYLIEQFPEIAAGFPSTAITTTLGVLTVNTGVIGGMITGVCVAILHRKFRTVKLPIMFSFFQGVRFVPVVSILVMLVLGQIFPFLWIYISQAIEFLGNCVKNAGALGPFVFATVERLLIPTGLHQIWNSVIRDTAVSGVFEFASGAIIDGARPAYAQFLIEGAPLNASLQDLVKYLFGPQQAIMMGALPAVALAMYHCADEDKKTSVKPLLIAGTFAAIFAGISEPLEFIFLFAAPLLYGIYAILNGLCWLLYSVLGSTIGSGTGLMGFLVHGLLREGCNWWITPIVTILLFITCYYLFKWWILHFDVKTPGRGGDYDSSVALAAEFSNISTDETKENIDVTDPKVMKAQLIIKGLGGKENIKEVDSCFSRLRVLLIDGKQVDEEIIRKTGCNGIVRPDENNIQIIYGTTVGMIKSAVKKELNR